MDFICVNMVFPKLVRKDSRYYLALEQSGDEVTKIPLKATNHDAALEEAQDNLEFTKMLSPCCPINDLADCTKKG